MKVFNLVMGMPPDQRVALYDYETGKAILPAREISKLMTMVSYRTTWRKAYIHAIRATGENEFALYIIEQEGER